MKKEEIVQATAAVAGNVATSVAPFESSVEAPPQDLESLFRAHHEQIFRAAYRITGSATDAEDVLQTIFLRLVRREAPLDPAPNPASYFHRAAVNAALDLLRSRTRDASVPLDVVEADLFTNPHHSPEAQHAGQELKRRVQHIVAQLSPRAAEIFALR